MLLLARIDAFGVQLGLGGPLGGPPCLRAEGAKGLATAGLRRGLAPPMAQVSQASALPWGGGHGPSLTRPLEGAPPVKGIDSTERPAA